MQPQHLQKNLGSLFAVGLIAASMLSGCAGQPRRKDGVVSGDQYEYVTPIGSNIPVLVKKGEQAPTSSPTGTVGADQAANAIHGGGGQMRSLPGEKP